MKKKSFLTVEGRAPVSQDALAESMIALEVEEKPGSWDPQTRTTAQKTDANGTPQWIVQVLFNPLANDGEHGPEVVPVTITSPTMPVIQAGRPVEFIGLATWTYLRRTRDGHTTGVARSFFADGLRQQAESDR